MLASTLASAPGYSILGGAHLLTLAFIASFPMSMAGS